MAYDKKKNQTVYSTQKSWSDTYLTDPNLMALLGPFDLDPCTPPHMPWPTAKVMLTPKEDGLKYDWSTHRVWMNPPYRGVVRWAEKFMTAKSGIALLNGRSTDTQATQMIMNGCDSIWFPKGRLTFYKPDGSSYPNKWFSNILLALTKEDTDYMYNAQEVYGGVIFQ